MDQIETALEAVTRYWNEAQRDFIKAIEQRNAVRLELARAQAEIAELKGRLSVYETEPPDSYMVDGKWVKRK